MKNLIWLILPLNLFFSFYSYASEQQQKIHGQVQKKPPTDFQVEKKRNRKKLRKNKKKPQLEKEVKLKKRKSTPQSHDSSSSKLSKVPYKKVSKKKSRYEKKVSIDNRIKEEKIMKCLDCHEPISRTYSFFGSPFILCPKCMNEYAKNS